MTSIISIDLSSVLGCLRASFASTFGDVQRFCAALRAALNEARTALDIEALTWCEATEPAQKRSKARYSSFR